MSPATVGPCVGTLADGDEILATTLTAALAPTAGLMPRPAPRRIHMGATMAISTAAAPICRMWRIQSIPPVKRTPNTAASQLPMIAQMMLSTCVLPQESSPVHTPDCAWTRPPATAAAATPATSWPMHPAGQQAGGHIGGRQQRDRKEQGDQGGQGLRAAGGEARQVGPLVFACQWPAEYYHGGCGSERGWRSRHWLLGPAPPGPLAFVCTSPAGQLPSSGVEIDASLVLEAAGRATAVWPTS